MLIVCPCQIHFAAIVAILVTCVLVVLTALVSYVVEGYTVLTILQFVNTAFSCMFSAAAAYLLWNRSEKTRFLSYVLVYLALVHTASFMMLVLFVGCVHSP